MADLLGKFAADPRGARLLRGLGLPTPAVLLRAAGGYPAQPLAGRQIDLGLSEGGQLAATLTTLLHPASGERIERGTCDTLVFDASGCDHPRALEALHTWFAPRVAQLARNGRVVIVGAPPANAANATAAACQRGVEGFTRALAKELGRRGAVANLLQVSPQAHDRLAAPLYFFAGPRTTYVSGQVIQISDAVTPPSAPSGFDTSYWLRGAENASGRGMQLRGKSAIVTGAARGIGAAIAARLAEEDARVLCLDVPEARDALYATAAAVGGVALPLDITAPDAGSTLCDFLAHKGWRADVVVHNAGITRDRTLARMRRDEWEAVMAVNLAAVIAIDEALYATGTLPEHARIICLSSVSGIAGNFGQSNYATSKAALIGYVAARAKDLAAHGVCVNAVAPGFIETAMTARIPALTREAGRRLNSLAQGGQPRDVAEAVCLLALPGACGISGQTLRVCGQALIGA